MPDHVNLNWSIEHPLWFGLNVLFFGMFIRVIHSLLKTIKITYDEGWSVKHFRLTFWRCFTGFFPRDGQPGHRSSEYFHVFFLGAFELAFYPVLIAINAWAVVGAWVGLKAIAQWKVWTEDRSIFNLFLIGNAMAILISVIFLTPLVTVKTDAERIAIPSNQTNVETNAAR